MMSARTQSDSDTFQWDAPQALFQTAIVDLGPHRGCWGYAITPDGERFIILTRQVQSESPAVAALNWR